MQNFKKKICITFTSMPHNVQYSISFQLTVFFSQYGFINTCLKSLVIEKFGEETWEKLRSVHNTYDM